MILFGGRYQSIFYGDTWEWDGNVWTNITLNQDALPHPREGASLVYDTSQKKMILFGGWAMKEDFGTTWLMDTSSTTER